MQNLKGNFFPLLLIVFSFEISGLLNKTLAKDGNPPAFLSDRGTGQPTSMFGTYINKGELILYPFLEFYRDKDLEYKPAELGYGLDLDYRGKYSATEGLVFIGYGFTDWLALEFETAVIAAHLETSPQDKSGAPAEISEAGLGDVEGQIRVRWLYEDIAQPELFSYFEAVAPVQTKKLLIATSDWELKLGSGLVKGFSWGTVTLRIAGEYSVSESKFELGEYAVEYLKRLSPRWRLYLGVEGTQDELELINEVQWQIQKFMAFKLNNALGLTSKATDWAPEIGMVFSLPVRNK